MAETGVDEGDALVHVTQDEASFYTTSMVIGRITL
jgi:hypothetical protein